MCVSTVLHSTSSGRIVVEVHTHALLLGALTREDIDSCGLYHFLSAIVAGLNIDNNITYSYCC